MKRFIKILFVYFIGNAASRLLSFLLLPLATKHINADLYGYADLSTNILIVVTSIVGMEIWTGILRYMFDYKDFSDKRKIASNGMVIAAFSMSIFTVGFIVVNLFMHLRYGLLIYLFGISYIIFMVLAYAARGLEHNTDYVVSGVLGSLLSFAVMLIGILKFHMQGDAIILSMIVANVTQAIYLEWRVKILRNFRKKDIYPRVLRSMVLYCLPLGINSVTYWLNSTFNRIVIQQKMGLDANGHYAAVMKFSSIILLVVTVFNLAWQELAYSMAGDSDKQEKYNMILKYYNRFVGCGVLMLIPLTSIAFPFIIKGNYVVARDIIPISYLATFLSTLCSFLGNIMCAEKNTMSTFTSNIIGAVVNIAVVYLLIGSFGLQAASISLVVGYSVVAAARMRFIRKDIKLNLDMKFFVPYIVIFAFTSFIFYRFSSGSLIILAVNGALFVLLLGYSVYTLRDLFKSLLSKIRRRRIKSV